MFRCRVVGVEFLLFLSLFVLLLLAGTGVSHAADSIGEATLAVQAEAVPEKNLNVGDQVYVGNEFVVGAEGTLSILFVDESLLTLLPGSRAVIEEFSMGKNGKKGKCVIKVLSGQYRWIPGQILAGGGLQYISDGSIDVANAPGSRAGIQTGKGPGPYPHKGPGGQVPAFVGSQQGNAQNGGMTAGVYYQQKCEDCPGGPAQIPGFTQPTSPGGSSGGLGAGVPIINTGAFAGGGGNGGFVPPIVPPGAIGGGTGGGNWIPSDDLMSLQGGVGRIDPAAAAAQDIASMMNPAAAAPDPGGGIMEAGGSVGSLSAPVVDAGGTKLPSSGMTSMPGTGLEIGSAAPAIEFSTVPASKGSIGSMTAPSIDSGSMAPPKVEFGSTAAPKVEIGRVAAPTVETGVVSAPKMESPIVISPKAITPNIDMETEALKTPLMK